MSAIGFVYCFFFVSLNADVSPMPLVDPMHCFSSR